jgi:hypothetical protein
MQLKTSPKVQLFLNVGNPILVPLGPRFPFDFADVHSEFSPENRHFFTDISEKKIRVGHRLKAVERLQVFVPPFVKETEFIEKTDPLAFGQSRMRQA